jgi:hypothetical protein
MTTINTTDDLLSLLQENREFREAARQTILTEELLALPAVFAAFASKIDQDISEIHADVRALHYMYRRQHDDLARFRGNYAIDAARNNDVEIAELFAQLRGMRRIQTRLLDKDELDDILNQNFEAVETLGLRDRAWRTFPKSDIIAEVTDRRNSSPGFYIAVEASYTGNIEDVQKATDHARILRCATGRDAYAIVAGVRKGPGLESVVFNETARFIQTNDENTAFWYPLDEDELGPPDPC